MGDDGREALERFVLTFTEAFNRDDLDGVMALFAEDAVYDEFTGRRSEGKTAIREAFVPQFRGDYGTIRFYPDDLFVAPARGAGRGPSGKALIRWRCRLGDSSGSREWRGLDVLHVVDGRVVEKHTYAKAAVPLLSEPT